MKGFLAVGYCPSQRTGGYYDVSVIEVEVNGNLFAEEWFNAPDVFPEAKKWFREKENFYFPEGKDPSSDWSEEQWHLCQTKDEAETKASKWENNDVVDEMFSAYSLGL